MYNDENQKLIISRHLNVVSLFLSGRCVKSLPEQINLMFITGFLKTMYRGSKINYDNDQKWR